MLKRISLHGFKSFCDRTDIPLGSGITAIVGPNGCGKSNLADAIRWVLGEQNPRVLRCSRLSDLVFSGTAKKKAMGMAEVELLLDGLFSQKEAAIKRRCARDGSGDYHINGRVSKWRDVVDAFLGTGLSHQGYVVIGQGMIHELIGGRPQDRRLWIEEASGVNRYKQDRKEVEQKLDQARANIVRLSDLLLELLSQKERLVSEASVTREYQSLSREKNILECFLALEKIKDDEKKLLSARKRVESWESQIAEGGLKLSSLREEKDLISVGLEPLKNEMESLMQDREGLVAKLLALEKDRDAQRAKLAFLLKEMEGRNVRARVLAKDLERVTSEVKDLTLKKEELTEKATHARENLLKAEEERKEKEGSWRHLSETVIELRGQMVKLTGNLGALAREKEVIRKNLERLGKELAVEESGLKDMKSVFLAKEQENSFLENQLNELKAEKGKKDILFGEISSQLKSKESSLVTASSEEKELETRLSFVSARKRLLEDMRDAYEGYARSTRTVLEASKNSILWGILGVPGDLFSCEPQYIKALSAALGGAAEYVVVKDEKSAKAAIEHLKKTRSGRCTFLPLNLLRPRDLHPRTASALLKNQKIRPLIDFIKYEKDVQKAAQYLLGRVLLAESHEEALSFMKESSFTARVVTLSGESFDPGGTITGGDAERHESIFQRKKELEALTQEEPKLRSLLAKAREELKRLQDEVGECSDSLAKAQREKLWVENRINQAQASLVQNRAAVNELRKKLEFSDNKIQELKNKQQSDEGALDVILAKERELTSEIGALEKRLKDCEEELKMNLLDDSGKGDSLSEALRVKESAERELSSVTMRLEGLNSEKSSLEKNIVDENREFERLKTLVTELEDKEASLSREMELFDKNFNSLKAVIQEKSLEIERREKRLAFLASEISRLSRETEHLSLRVDEGKKDVLAFEESLNESKESLEHKYGTIDRNALEISCTRDDAYSRISSLESKILALGNVNLKVEEELLAFQQRLEMLEKEKKDVESAIDELEEAKRYVDDKIRDSFLETFEKVSENFSHIFQRLFGGGSGELMLDDSLGVDVICQVPGRRGKDLNLLSGGERSLCGIALLFAILRTKPSPLIVLDEVDAALDGANVVRFSQFLKDYSDHTQFIVITHKEATIETADVVYGVTMEEPGVSKVFGMRVEAGS